MPSHTPAWYPQNQWPHQPIPRRWRDYLLDKGSLTRRLISASNGNFSVNVLRQQMATPTVDEARALGVAHRQKALIREVTLLGNNQPWVYARSIIPAAMLSGRLRSLRKLDDRPLGALLFSDPTMARGEIEVAHIPGAMIPDGLAPENDTLWGRRSVFYLENKPLLVSEIFLSAFTP